LSDGCQRTQTLMNSGGGVGRASAGAAAGGATCAIDAVVPNTAARSGTVIPATLAKDRAVTGRVFTG